MLNKVILMGRLTADPELRHTPSGTSVTSFSLAVNRSFSRSGEQAQTDFIDVVAWSGTAEFVSKWFTKGLQVAVCGRLQTRTWEDKQGNKRKAVEVVAEEVHFADSKRDGSGNRTAGNQSMPFDLPANGGGFDELADDESQLPF